MSFAHSASRGGGCKTLTVDIWDGIDGDTRVLKIDELLMNPLYVVINRDGTCTAAYSVDDVDVDDIDNIEDFVSVTDWCDVKLMYAFSDTQYNAEYKRTYCYYGTYVVKGSLLYLEFGPEYEKMIVRGDDAQAFKEAYLAEYSYDEGIFDEKGHVYGLDDENSYHNYEIDMSGEENKLLSHKESTKAYIYYTIDYKYNKDGNPLEITYTSKDNYEGSKEIKSVRKYEYANGKLSRWTQTNNKGVIGREELFEYNEDGSVSYAKYGDEVCDIDVSHIKDCVKLQNLLVECVNEWREETGASNFALISEEELLARYTAKTGETELPCCPHPEDVDAQVIPLFNAKRGISCGVHFGSESVISADIAEEWFEGRYGIKYSK